MKRKRNAAVGAAALTLTMVFLGGCSTGADSGKIQISMVQYKLEAVKVFEKLEADFNASHPDIELKIESPNDAMTVLKTMLIKEEEPDIIGIGGDISYSNFLDADILMDISDYEGLSDVKPAYLAIDKNLEFVPKDGVYAVPYVGNAAGILYNREMFAKNGWEIPTTWDELISLCDTIQASGQQPFFFGMKDTWTCLAPWNALCVSLAPEDICAQVNRKEATFTQAYGEATEKIYQLLPYAQKDPFGYSYNDACTAFARGEAAMYPIGSYAVPQIKSVNPDMDIDSFVFPASNDPEGNTLNSGIDLQFCIMKDSKNKEAAMEVLKFLQQDENVQMYLDDQNAVPCKEGDFTLSPMLDGMKSYIDEGKMADYQDHYYPAEMSVDALIQTYLINGDAEEFLARFDKDWIRYNRDVIRKVQKYQEENTSKGGK